MEAVRDRERTFGTGSFMTAVEAGNVRPMIEVVWEGALKVRAGRLMLCFFLLIPKISAVRLPVLVLRAPACWIRFTVSLLIALLKQVMVGVFEAAEDRSTVNVVLDFYHHMIHLTASLGMEAAREAIVKSLTERTNLDNPPAMRVRHLEALRTLVSTAEADANNMGASDTPRRCSTCISSLM